MPRGRRQLDGRAHLVADQMDGVEVLREADEVAVVPVVSRTTTPLAIVNIGRTCDQPEVDAVPAHGHALVGVARGERKGRGCAPQCTLDEAAVQADSSRRRVDLGARGLENGKCAGRHHLHPQILEDSQRSQFNGLELIRRQHLHGQVRIADLSPRQLRNAASVKTSAAAPLTSPVRLHGRRLCQVVQRERSMTAQ